MQAKELKVAEKPVIMTIGLLPEISEFLYSQAKTECDFLEKSYDQGVLEEAIEPKPSIIFCGPESLNTSVIEVGQSLRMFYPDTAIYFITKDRQIFDRPNLRKNGFNESYLLPFDELTLLRNLKKEISRVTGGKVKAYRKIHLVDVAANTTLGFDLYLHLPANNKRIRYASADQSLDEGQVEKLRKYNYQSAFVSEDQVHRFYEFTARHLKSIQQDSKLSETEKAEKREAAVRDVLTGLLSESVGDNIGHGREMMEDCQEIIKAYVLDESSGQASWYEQLISLASSNADNTAYTHAANTSTFAALFSIALGIGDPKELALAGLLHDVGLTDVPSEICNKPESLRTPEEQSQYEQHPLHSVQLIKLRKMIVSEKILTMIEQHHERFDGQGYPAKVPGPRIMPESQVLALADLIHEMTAVQEGKERVFIIDALTQICEKGFSNPGASAFDPSLLRKVKNIFLNKNERPL